MTPPYQAIDAHTHLDFDALAPDLDAVVARARAAGVVDWVIAGADPNHWDRAAHVADRTGGALCLGVHPWWVRERDADQLRADLNALTSWDELQGIGETGLDWHRDRPDSEAAGLQRASYAAHIELAHYLGLPLVLHLVRAHGDGLGMLSALDLPAAGGMVHAWSAGPEWVGPALDLGLFLSFGTDLLRSSNVREAAAKVPLDRLLVETDSPDRPIAPHTRGEPAHLVDVIDCMAAVHRTSPERIAEATLQNCRALFPALQEAPP